MDEEPKSEEGKTPWPDRGPDPLLEANERLLQRIKENLWSRGPELRWPPASSTG